MSLLHFEFNYLAWRSACQAKPEGRLITGQNLAWFSATLHADFKTAFTTLYSQFQFQTLPIFRLSGAPSSFQILMDRLITRWSSGCHQFVGRSLVKIWEQCWIAWRKLDWEWMLVNVNLVQAIVCILALNQCLVNWKLSRHFLFQRRSNRCEGF